MLCNRSEFSITKQDSIYPRGDKEKDRLLDYNARSSWNGAMDTSFANFGVEK